MKHGNVVCDDIQQTAVSTYHQHTAADGEVLGKVNQGLLKGKA